MRSHAHERISMYMRSCIIMVYEHVHEIHASSWTSHHKSSVTIATTCTICGVSGPKVACTQPMLRFLVLPAVMAIGPYRPLFPLFVQPQPARRSFALASISIPASQTSGPASQASHQHLNGPSICPSICPSIWGQHLPQHLGQASQASQPASQWPQHLPASGPASAPASGPSISSISASISSISASISMAPASASIWASISSSQPASASIWRAGGLARSGSPMCCALWASIPSIGACVHLFRPRQPWLLGYRLSFAPFYWIDIVDAAPIPLIFDLRAIWYR
jgi:hypothetical protein